MLKSMTAFGRARRMSSDNALDITVELKGVNSRFMDCTVKLPRMYGFLEEKVKAYLAEAGIARGKIDIAVSVDVIEQRGLEVMLDKEAARSYLTALRELRDAFDLRDDISVMAVAQNRDLFSVKKPEDDAERDWQEIRAVLAEAVEGFNAMRTQEGENLCADILKKVKWIESLAGKIRVLSEKDISTYRPKLEQRIRQILKDCDIEMSEQRILTEAAIFADKAAIDEEVVRLGSHFKALREIVRSNEPNGKKLDFLVQEINRETNTIGSKAGNAEIAHLVVDMKTEIEKIREQIQNLE